MVTLDLEYCEEVASTSSPNNPAARDDLGTMAAHRQANLADNLYPFKLVYDDGTERLGCDSAKDRSELRRQFPPSKKLTTQSVGFKPYGPHWRGPEVDLLLEHHRLDPNGPCLKSVEAMLVDPLPPIILLSAADPRPRMLFRYTNLIELYMLPMIKW